MTRRRLVLLAALMSLATWTGARAQVASAAAGPLDPAVPANFAVVVYNENDPIAAPLAKFYAEKGGIPPERMVALKCSLAEEISREQYDREIAQPLRRAFDAHRWWDRPTEKNGVNSASPVTANRIRYLVLMRGMPL